MPDVSTARGRNSMSISWDWLPCQTSEPANVFNWVTQGLNTPWHREFALGVQPECQFHDRPKHVVAPCVLVPASCFTMLYVLVYIFHFLQDVF